MSRLLSILILLVTLSLVVPLAFAAVAMLHGTHLPVSRWLFPLCLIAAGAGLIKVRSWRVPLTLMWLIVAGYYWMQILAVR